jgi:hypothetical protein
VRGEALLRTGDAREAQRAFEAGLAAARARNDLFETLLLLLGLIRVSGRLGVAPPDGAEEESRKLRDLLKIRVIAHPAKPA